MTKDSTLSPLYALLAIIALLLVVLCGIVNQLTRATILNTEVNLKILELTDELVKIEWQAHGAGLDQSYPVDPTFDPNESAMTL